MASAGAAAVVAVLVICSVLSVSATLQDGIPRPTNFPDQPTTVYDNTPALATNGVTVDCTWYGFANVLYAAATGASCLTVLRLALTNATVNPPASMHPYSYYTLKRLVDASNNESYCYQGCFNLGTLAPTPGVVAAPSPVVAAPAPITFGVPPSNSLSPAPSVYPGAPPSDTTPSTSPLGAAVPPASIYPPGSAPSPGLGVPFAGPVSSPPAPPTVPLNSGPLLQPTTLFSFLVAFVAVLVNLAA